jgi:hypothetical protein
VATPVTLLWHRDERPAPQPDAAGRKQPAGRRKAASKKQAKKTEA